ncbi:Protein of unknown function [Bacillus toyonensis]|nr:Protein of unknown function [Bacillus mycoides]SCC09200.1 Protein of unknown function [Bacillus mobilis]SCM94742.1 Protein of unknown function [Bacillus cereus]SCN03166.1 Protein of unknown function [Bacillus wiedmannii]SCN16085.1 Protein of unknown function [Bacillus toyonensis]
MKKKFQKL